MTQAIVAQCAFEGCLKTIRARGYCKTHYARLRETGILPKIFFSPIGKCSIEGCNVDAKCKGKCATHYSRDNRRTKICVIDGCEQFVFARGWCIPHYELWRKYGSPFIRRRPAKDASIVERFWGRVVLTADDSRCWEWIGETNDNGYGIFNFEKTCYRAHRYAWFLVKGEHPRQGMFLCHTCDNSKCVNPNHLYEGTNQDNIRDRVERGGVPQKQKLPVEMYRQIQNELHKTTQELSVKYGFSQHIIRLIRSGTHWSNRVYG